MSERIKVSLEIKSLSDRQFEGYGAVFKNVDYGGDIIVPGAFKQSLATQGEKLPVMLWMHQPDQVPGKWLSMTEDKHGLLVKGELADTQLGRETHTLLKMGAVTGMSIGYITQKSDFTSDGTRLLKQVDLLETSIVSMPMNPLAQVTAVKTRTSLTGEYVPTVRDLEKEFRRMGCSQKVAKQLIAKIYEGSDGTPEPEEDEVDGTSAKSDETVPVQRDAEVDDETEVAAKLIDLANSLAAERFMRRLQR